MEPEKNDNIIKNIMQIAPKHCENCGSKYEVSDFNVMKSTSVSTLVHLKCSKCSNTYMLNVVSPVSGMVGTSRMPLNLDLNSLEEVSKFAGLKPVEQDEAIDAYAVFSPESFPELIKKLTKPEDSLTA